MHWYNILNCSLISTVTSWLPPLYHYHPVPYSPPFTRLLTGVDEWERRGAETTRAGGCLDEAAGEVTAPRAPDLRGEHVWLPDSAPYLDSSFQNTAPPSQTPQHDEGTISLVYFGHFILLFLFNKILSEAWCHTHCVCRLLFPPHYIEGMWLRYGQKFSRNGFTRPFKTLELNGL